MMIFDKQVKIRQQRNKKANIKNSCQSRESNPGTIASQSGALPLDLREN